MFMGRSSRRSVSVKKAVLKNFAVYIGKHLCWSIFFKASLLNSFLDLRPATLLKKRHQQCFPVIITKFLSSIFTEHFRVAASAWDLSALARINFLVKYRNVLTITKTRNDLNLRETT